jgi:hypothetical protein
MLLKYAVPGTILFTPWHRLNYNELVFMAEMQSTGVPSTVAV